MSKKLTPLQDKMLKLLITGDIYLGIHQPRTPGLFKPSAQLLRFDGRRYAGDINLRTAKGLVAKGAVKRVENLDYKTVSGTMTVWEAN